MERTGEKQIEEFESFLKKIEERRKEQQSEQQMLNEEINITQLKENLEEQLFCKEEVDMEEKLEAAMDECPPTLSLAKWTYPDTATANQSSEEDEKYKGLTQDELFLMCEDFMENLSARISNGFPLVKNLKEQKSLFKIIKDHEDYFRDRLPSIANVIIVRWAGIFKRRFGYRCVTCCDPETKPFFDVKLKYAFADQESEIKFIKDRSHYCQVCGLGLFWLNKEMKASMHTFDDNIYSQADLNY